MSGYMTLPQLARYVAGVLVAMACLTFVPALANHLLDSPSPSIGDRWAAVLVGTLSVVPLLAIIGYGVSQADEYARQIFLVGIALAAAGSLCLTTAVEYMKDARLVPEAAVVPYWLAMMLFWAAGTLGTSLYYRLRR
jgi:hypothetical protein